MPAPPSTSLPRRSTCPPSSPPNRDSARLTCNALIKATAQRIPDAALCSHAPTEDSPMKAQRTDRVRGATLHRAVCAKLSRSREKAPRNPDLRPWPERETAGQAPVPRAREAPTSGSMVGCSLAAAFVDVHTNVHTPGQRRLLISPKRTDQSCQGRLCRGA